MTTAITRRRYNSLDDKAMDEDNKCNNYTDMLIGGEAETDYKTISEGSSGSSIAEMNNNTNGKVMANGPHDNINDNRQLMKEPSNVKAHAVKGPGTGTVMKKITQISMDEVPLHLSGLSISGSGMELFVKLDENLDKALRQASRTVATRHGKKRKKMTKTRKLKNYLHVGNSVANATNDIERQFMDDTQNRLDEALTKENDSLKPSDHLTGALKLRTKQTGETTRERETVKEVSGLADQSKPSERESVHQLNPTPYDRQAFFNAYRWNPNFQHEKPMTPTATNNYLASVIRGPTWNFENGQIDVIKSQGNLQSVSNIQNDMVTTKESAAAAAVYDAPIDYSMNLFPRGFESKNLPLKRRMSPPRWPSRHVKEARYDYEDPRKMNNACSSNDCPRKEVIRRVRDGKVRKLSMKKAAPQRVTLPSTSQDESLEAAENNFIPMEHDAKPSPSDVSNGQVSSVGPQFQTDLLTPQTMDAETLIKFTEFTHNLRKDLKQKYKDLSELLKTFEETVQFKNSVKEKKEEEESQESEPQVGRCVVM